jgi:glycosyltransferase involved in cell wall biosynthesis
VSALADALEQLIEDHDLRRNLGQAARRDHAERFEIGSYVTQLVAIWRQSQACPATARLGSADPESVTDDD